MKYFLWNKASDYYRGHMENLQVDGDELRLSDRSGAKAGYYLSRRIDAGEQETAWHRLKADIHTGDNMSARFSIYATDSKLMAEQVDAALKAEDGHSLNEQMERMHSLQQMEVNNPEDILLHQVKGRYLWLGIVIWGNGADSPGIRMVQIYFPKELWNRYLPEIYQTARSEFLGRYLAIFQSLHDDLEQRIRKDTSFLDIQAADAGQLTWIAGWLDEADSSLWTEDGLRSYLAESAELYRCRGTARGLVRMIELFTGERPYLVEAAGETEEEAFTLFIRDTIVSDSRSYQTVLRIIRECKPAGIPVRLLPLRPYLLLDEDTYMGINSELNIYADAVLGRDAVCDFVVLGGNMDEESDLSAL